MNRHVISKGGRLPKGFTSNEGRYVQVHSMEEGWSWMNGFGFGLEAGWQNVDGGRDRNARTTTLTSPTAPADRSNHENESMEVCPCEMRIDESVIAQTNHNPPPPQPR